MTLVNLSSFSDGFVRQVVFRYVFFLRLQNNEITNIAKLSRVSITLDNFANCKLRKSITHIILTMYILFIGVFHEYVKTVK